jgi:hypothetical protein
MGRMTREKEEKERRKEERVVSGLIEHSRRKTPPPPITASLVLRGVALPAQLMLRTPETWTPKLRTKDIIRHRLELVRHCFKRYPVPKFLDRVWNDGVAIERADRRAARLRAEGELPDFREWWIRLARGDSLYKNCSKGILSAKETHLFLQAPEEDSPLQALWRAKALALGATRSLCGRIVGSAMARSANFSEQWSSFLALIIREPPESIDRINWLRDWAAAKIAEDPTWTAKGRTLASAERACEEWHRLVAKQAEWSTTNWTPFPIDDWFIELPAENQRNVPKDQKRMVRWRVHQITSGKQLVLEGHAQRHCVASYKNSCVNGRCSIFSMTLAEIPWPGAVETPERALTIEVSSSFSIVQARGWCNRPPSREENTVLSAWARANDLSINL